MIEPGKTYWRYQRYDDSPVEFKAITLLDSGSVVVEAMSTGKTETQVPHLLHATEGEARDALVKTLKCHIANARYIVNRKRREITTLRQEIRKAGK